ncbi:hypothetical protein ABIA33_005358 [Streptacidiphilus sp. MAP12-16]|uniref:BTAD domain-containing putative transcriptional regulator n=1 Tax=Streptacidiphilus sp. MAP12-16 TaxID=3156300 RepID=UPI003512401B
MPLHAAQQVRLRHQLVEVRADEAGPQAAARGDRGQQARVQRNDRAGVLPQARTYGAEAGKSQCAWRIRCCLEAHLRGGNASEALRHYESYRRLLEGELGLEPSPLLRRLLLLCTRAS